MPFFCAPLETPSKAAAQYGSGRPPHARNAITPITFCCRS
jgi:hypothetical protein